MKRNIILIATALMIGTAFTACNNDRDRDNMNNDRGTTTGGYRSDDMDDENQGTSDQDNQRDYNYNDSIQDNSGTTTGGYDQNNPNNDQSGTTTGETTTSRKNNSGSSGQGSGGTTSGTTGGSSTGSTGSTTM